MTALGLIVRMSSRALIKFGLSCYTCCFLKEGFERHILEFFVKIRFKMLDTITMGTIGENKLDGFEETFLTIREKNKSLFNEELKCMALNDH